MQEGPEDFFLSSKARYQKTQDDEDAAELFFAIRNMTNHGLEVEWDDTLLKAKRDLEAFTGTKVEEKPKSKPEGKIRGRTQTHRERLFGTKRTEDSPEVVRTTGHLYEEKGIESEDGVKTITTVRQPGGREATQYNRPTIPSQHFDEVLSLMRKSGDRPMTPHDIDFVCTALLENTPEELEAKKEEWIEGSDGVSYGDVLRVVTGRPEPFDEDKGTAGGESLDYPNRRRLPDPMQALCLFSETPHPGGTTNSLHKFNSATLDPESARFIEKTDKEIAQANLESHDRRLRYGVDIYGNRKKGPSHLDSLRVRNRRGEIVYHPKHSPSGGELPRDNINTHLYHDAYNEWYNRLSQHLSDELSDYEKRLLFRDWHDLEIDIGRNDEYIFKKLLKPDGSINKEYSREELMMDPEFRKMRDQSHERLGLLPLMLGLQLGSPESRQYAIAEFLTYKYGNTESGIEDSHEERLDNRGGNMGSLLIEDLIEHMDSECLKWVSAFAHNWKATGTESGTHFPATVPSESQTRDEILAEALRLAHKVAMDSRWVEKGQKKGEYKGYDAVGAEKRRKFKSIADHIRSSGIEWDDIKGRPADWDSSKPPLEELQKYIGTLPAEFQESARRRFHHWLKTDLRGLIRGDRVEYQRSQTSHTSAMKPRVLGEGPEPYEKIKSWPRGPAFSYHDCLPHTGLNLADGDIMEAILAYLSAFGVDRTASEYILMDSYDIEPPPIDTPEYEEWLKGWGTSRNPLSWDVTVPFKDRGDKSDLANEVDRFLRHGDMGPTIKSLYERTWGKLEASGGKPLDLSERDIIRRLRVARLGEITQEEVDMGNIDSPERAGSYNITEGEETVGEGTTRSSLYPARSLTSRTFGRRLYIPPSSAGHKGLASTFLHILPKDAMFLRIGEHLGLVSNLQKFGERVMAEFQAGASRRQTEGGQTTLSIKEDLEDKILTDLEAVRRRSDQEKRKVEYASILGGTGAGTYPIHVKSVFNPIRKLVYTAMNRAYGAKHVHSSSRGDGHRDDKQGLRRGAGATLPDDGTPGVPLNLPEENGYQHLLMSALLGLGVEPAWDFGSDDDKRLVISNPSDWGKEYYKKMDQWLEAKKHPHIQGQSLLGHLGIHPRDSNWRNHPEVQNGRYKYSIKPTIGDTGKREFRIPLVFDDNYTTIAGAKLLGLGAPSSCPDNYKSEHAKQWNEPFNFDEQQMWTNYDEQGRPSERNCLSPSEMENIKAANNPNDQFHRERQSRDYIVVPEKHIVEDNGNFFLIGEHPAKLKDDYAVLLGRDKTAFSDEDIVKLRAQAAESAPEEMSGGVDMEGPSGDKVRGMESLVRAFSVGMQGAKAMYPLIKTLFASEMPQLDSLEGEGEEDRAARQMKFFEDSFLNETGQNVSSNLQKRAFHCHLIEMAYEYARNSHKSNRESLLASLEGKGFVFKDREKDSIIDPFMGNNVEMGESQWLMPDKEKGSPFHEAFTEGNTRDVEGLEILRLYIDRVHSDSPQKREALLRMLDDHFILGGGELDYSDKPVATQMEDIVSDINTTGKMSEHMQNIKDAQHYLSSLNADKPDWDPVAHYVKEGPSINPVDSPRLKTSDKSREQERVRRGIRAAMTLNLRKRIVERNEESMGSHHEHERFMHEMMPVMDGIMKDLRRDNLLLGHRPHRKYDSKSVEQAFEEYSRLLFLRAPKNDNYRQLPHGVKQTRRRGIGDNREDPSSEEEWYDSTTFPKLSGVHAQHMFGNAQPMPAVMNFDRHGEHPTIHWSPEGFGGPFDALAGSNIQLVGATSDEATRARRDVGNVFNKKYLPFGASVIDYVSANNHTDDSTTGTSMNQATREYADGDALALSVTSLDVLTDVDLLYKDEDRDKGDPVPVKAMHRIFELSDLEYLRGFSDDWVVTSWADGVRLMVEKKGDKVKARNSEGKAATLPNAVKRGVVDAHKKDFLVDCIWDEDVLHIVDLLECEDDDLSNRPAKDRVRHLRAHFESTEQVFTPAPVNTKRVDGEGLERAVKDLLKEPKVKQVLLRDAESTYMRGESRHPKWVMLTPDQYVDVLVLSSTSDNNHLVGVGPLYDEDARAIGNRGVKYDGEYYMDVGNVSRSGLEEGMYITVKTSGISHSVRRGFSVYRLNAPRYVKECEGGATDSVETLDILRNRQEGNVPHKLRVKKGSIHIEVPTGHVVYDTESHGNAFILKGVDAPDDYTLRIVESQMDYWSPLAAVLLRSEKESEKEDIEPEPPANHDKKPKKVLPKKDVLLKDPEVVKTVVVALEAVENMIKEKITWTGPKGLGMDYATPVESPRGPTEVTEPHNLPDHDSGHRQSKKGDCWCGAKMGEECKQGMGHDMEDCPRAHPPKKEERADHLEISHDSRQDSPV